ncbi:MAG: SIMPL domain-containing protein [Pseudomonadota bacterium]
MRTFLLPIVAVATLLPFSPAKADQQDPILTLPDGQVILNISATVRQEVEQDLLVATLRYSAENRDAKKLQNEINEAMQKALKRAKEEDKEIVKINTGAYNVYERTDNRTKEKKWYGQQTITVKSKDSEKILKLTGDLQEMGLKMTGLNYTLDPKTAVKVQDDLMEDAIKELTARADRVAKALGKSSAEIRELNTSSQSYMPQPKHYARSEMAMTASADSMAAPVAAAGEDTISMTVNGRAIIKP